MRNSLSRWLDSYPLTDPIERRQASVFQWVLIAWILLAVFWVPFSLIGFLQPPPPDVVLPPVTTLFIVLFWLSIIDTILLLAVPLVALVVLRRGHLRLSVMITAFGQLLAHSIATYSLGITNGAVLIVFQIPIALAGLLLGRRHLLTIAGLSIAIVCVVTFLESFSPPLAGFFAVMPSATGEIVSPLANQSVPLLLGFFIGVTILLTILLDRFGGALRDALAISLAREEELRGIRASLEATVAERTVALQTALDEVRVRAEEQAHLLTEIEYQRITIKDLSVPVIPVSAHTLVVPLVGALNALRLQQLQEQSLHALERSSARLLVLDITGVPIVDSQVAQGLFQTVQAARLLGAEVALVGIRPEVAQSIVGLGLDLQKIRTFSDLQSALDRVAA